MSDTAADDTILLPIDLHGVNRTTLDLLLRIAGHLHCRVTGLLVEDSRLQQVAELPFTTEVVLASGGERDLVPTQLRAHLSRVSRNTQKLLAELATRYRVQLSYEAASGVTLPLILQRGSAVNVFLPARARRARLRVSAPGSVAIHRLGLVLGGTGCDQRILALARALASDATVGRLDVIASQPPDPVAIESLGHHGPRPRWLRLDCPAGGAITQLIRCSRYDLLVLPFDCLQDVAPAPLEAALSASGSQVLMVR